AGALQDDGFGGDVRLDGCDVTLEPSTALIVDGGSAGHAGQLSVVAHERLAFESLATISALPDGASALTYRVDESIAPDAILQPAFTLLTDPTLTPCPACGNGQIEPLEDCDGRGTCPGSGEVCVPAGSPGECSCAATCGTVAGIQPGEDCDGTDLGCAACGNGFVDPGEECDEGAGNRDAPNHCRHDCTLPRCGDATLDFPHCAGDPDTACTTTEDCPAGAACEPGEACDLGTATCIG